MFTAGVDALILEKFDDDQSLKKSSKMLGKTGDFVLVLKSYGNNDPDHSHISVFKSGALD